MFFEQKPVGLDRREFYMIKSRSMVVDAEARHAELQTWNDGACLLFEMGNDPRIASAGQMLREHSLDELPELFNVIGGSMPLVGPVRRCRAGWPTTPAVACP